jgi:hypothetical protein
MFLESTLAILTSLTQASQDGGPADAKPDERGGVSNAADEAALQLPKALKQLVEGVKFRLELLDLRFKLWRLEWESRKREYMFFKLREDHYRRFPGLRQIDIPKVPEDVPNRLPPGHRRV